MSALQPQHPTRIELHEIDPELRCADGFDDCIVGVVEQFGKDPIVCYDKMKMLEKLMADNELTYEQADEHFNFNIIGAYVGPRTPCFVTKVP